MNLINIIKISLAAVAIILQSAIGFSQSIQLNDEEKSDLLLMLEEEKLARDVYYTLGEKWDLTIFENIASSEERHLDLVTDVAKNNKITIPEPVELNKIGVFENEDLQSLYNLLINTGNESIVSALEVGAKIEELDIKDLENALVNTENQELIDLYTPLRNASENHLRAFIKNLSKQDVEYKPEILDQAKFTQIITGTNTKANCKSGERAKSCKGKEISKCKGKSEGKKGCCSTS